MMEPLPYTALELITDKLLYIIDMDSILDIPYFLLYR